MLQIHELSCGYRGQAVVEGLSFCLTPGEILCLLGPNGVGKTTLFKTILNLQPRLGGEIRVDGSDIAAWTPARRGRTIAYVPQAHIPPFPFTVLQVATMGFAARLGAFGRPGSTEQRAAAAILERLGIGHLADRVYTEISGGERQMVLIARALVQEPRILILDEPTSNLDFGNQVRVLALINSLASQGMAVLMTTHFPNHVFLCSTGVILMGPGRRVRAGTLDAVVTEANLEQAYGIRVRLARIDLEDGLSVRTCLPLMGSEPRMYAGNR